jgi:S-methylmethionine-dependent homocysteine/selenocysteine methylase
MKPALPLAPKDIQRAAKYHALKSLIAYAESLEAIHEEPLKSGYAFEADRMTAHAAQILQTDSWVADWSPEVPEKSPKEQRMAQILKEMFSVAERAIDDRWMKIESWEPLSREPAREELQRIYKYGTIPSIPDLLPPSDWSAWTGALIARLSFLLTILQMPEESKL